VRIGEYADGTDFADPLVCRGEGVVGEQMRCRALAAPRAEDDARVRERFRTRATTVFASASR
jgi:hypothetical protein